MKKLLALAWLLSAFALSFVGIPSHAMNAITHMGAVHLDVWVTTDHINYTYNTDNPNGLDYDLTILVFDWDGNMVGALGGPVLPANGGGFESFASIFTAISACQDITIRVEVNEQTTNVTDFVVESDFVRPCGTNAAETNSTSPNVVINPCADGRANSDNCSAPIAIYLQDGFLQIYGINTASVGILVANLNIDENEETGLLFAGTNTASGYPIEVYLLENSEIQINTNYHDGKAYIIRFSLDNPSDIHYLAH